MEERIQSTFLFVLVNGVLGLLWQEGRIRRDLLGLCTERWYSL